MDKETSRNTIIFFVCALGLLIAYNFLVLQPTQKREAALKAQQAAVQAAAPAAAGPAAPTLVPVPQALAASPRVTIDTPAGTGANAHRGLTGSISLVGAKFDDLDLKGYHETIDPKSPLIELLRPQGAQYAYFAQFGWTGQNLPGLPDLNTTWTLASGTTLSPGHPVRLTYTSEQGLTFTRDISVDDEFMFTVADTVVNAGAEPVTLTPFAAIEREGIPPPGLRARPSNDGVFSMLGNGGQYRGPNIHVYRKWAKDGQYSGTSTGGWMGLGDKYWLAALVPDQKEAIQTHFTSRPFGTGTAYVVRYDGPARALAPGTQITETRRFFAGAKLEPVLDAYAKSVRDPNQAVPRFTDAIDWGWGYFITKPLFWMIKFFQGYVGNFGIAILMLTIVIKIVFFFPANMSFASMTKMKKIQPQMDKLKVRFKDDPAAMQQAVMKLYKDEKINPLLGCLPMLATIPVFLALFKVLNTTIEMYHAPFFGWIQDLSDRDPTSILQLFGLIHWHPEAVPLIGTFLDGPLHLGVWPLLYGITMLLTQSMSPPAADPTQQAIMKWLPVVFTFVMSSFAAGLIIYYCWSNFLTIIQQYVIMRRYKVDNPIDGIIRRITGKPAPAG
ncbi:MAG: membrane protein insertase YidC [Alphaproteobacteria bacterium]